MSPQSGIDLQMVLGAVYNGNVACDTVGRIILKYSDRYKQRETISAEVVARLRHYAGPGNVRESQNIPELLVVLTREQDIGLHNPPRRLKPLVEQERRFNAEAPEVIPLKEALVEGEKKLIRQFDAK